MSEGRREGGSDELRNHYCEILFFRQTFFHGGNVGYFSGNSVVKKILFAGNDEKVLALPSKALESLFSQSSDPKEFVLQLKHCMQLDQASLEKPDPETKRLIRCLATKAKQSNRLDVIEQLREITPAGTTGEVVTVVVSLYIFVSTKLVKIGSVAFRQSIFRFR